MEASEFRVKAFTMKAKNVGNLPVDVVSLTARSGQWSYGPAPPRLTESNDGTLRIWPGQEALVALRIPCGLTPDTCPRKAIEPGNMSATLEALTTTGESLTASWQKEFRPPRLVLVGEPEEVFQGALAQGVRFTLTNAGDLPASEASATLRIGNEEIVLTSSSSSIPPGGEARFTESPRESEGILPPPGPFRLEVAARAAGGASFNWTGPEHRVGILIDLLRDLEWDSSGLARLSAQVAPSGDIPAFPTTARIYLGQEAHGLDLDGPAVAVPTNLTITRTWFSDYLRPANGNATSLRVVLLDPQGRALGEAGTTLPAPSLDLLSVSPNFSCTSWSETCMLTTLDVEVQVGTDGPAYFGGIRLQFQNETYTARSLNGYYVPAGGREVVDTAPFLRDLARGPGTLHVEVLALDGSLLAQRSFRVDVG
jgi:hypothetical protein